jgi:hypothetical protein
MAQTLNHCKEGKSMLLDFILYPSIQQGDKRTPKLGSYRSISSQSLKRKSTILQPRLVSAAEPLYSGQLSLLRYGCYLASQLLFCLLNCNTVQPDFLLTSNFIRDSLTPVGLLLQSHSCQRE